MSTRPRTAFVLGGGGKWGAVEVGMLRALDEEGVRPDLILGASIGALNGSVIAADPGSAGVSRLESLWDDLSSSDLFSGGMFDRLWSVATLKPAIHDSDELRRALVSVHGEDRMIEDLRIPFQCVAASIERAAEHWFTEGPLVDALLATSAVPMLMPPVRVGEEHFYDGGLVNSVPLARAVRLGATCIYVLQVGRVESPLRVPEKLHEAGLISFEIARRHTFAAAVADTPEGVEVHLLPSGNPVAFDDRRQLRWRDTSDTAEMVEDAYEASRAYLSELAGM